MMSNDENQLRRKAFVTMRRRWFALVLMGTLVVLLLVTGRRFNSVAEIVGFALMGALILATMISLASAPVLWILSGRYTSGGIRSPKDDGHG